MEPIVTASIEDALSGPWFWIRDLDCSRDELLAHLGPPHWVTPEEGLLYDVNWWCFRAECGLRLSYSMMQDGSSGALTASLPESEHALRHDPWARSKSKPREDQYVDRDETELIQRFQREFPALGRLHDFQVWRMGDDGNAMPVGYPTSELDAQCLVAGFESHKYRHKQIYWYSELDPKRSGGTP
jgi:hypothetical protein